VSDFDLRALVAALHAREVEFIVVGGVAVGAHGYLRATRDLDVVPDPEHTNLRRLAAALGDVAARLPLAGNRAFDLVQDLARLERRSNMTLDTKHGGLDVIQHAPGVPSFEILNSTAVEADLLGVPVRIVSLENLRAMKAAAGRAQDRADLENLPDPG
jgi:hypothetical protein